MTLRNRVIRPASKPSWAASRAPARPASASPTRSRAWLSRVVNRAYGAANWENGSANVRREQSVDPQMKRRTVRRQGVRRLTPASPSQSNTEVTLRNGSPRSVPEPRTESICGSTARAPRTAEERCRRFSRAPGCFQCFPRELGCALHDEGSGATEPRPGPVRSIMWRLRARVVPVHMGRERPARASPWMLSYGSGASNSLAAAVLTTTDLCEAIGAVRTWGRTPRLFGGIWTDGLRFPRPGWKRSRRSTPTSR